MKTILLSFRRLNGNNLGTLLGIAGLVVGLVCVLYIYLWTTNELSYDRFNTKLDRIFVVHAYLDGEGASGMQFGGCPPMVAPSLKADYPEVEESCRLCARNRCLLSYGDNKNIEYYAMGDFSIFDIFTFPFIYGNKGEEGAMNRIILNRTTALKYFGEGDPVGKSMRLDSLDMTVVGVIEDIPKQSSLSFSMIVPMEIAVYTYGSANVLSTWGNNGFPTFGLLKQAEGYNKVASTITRRLQKEIPESINYLRSYQFKDRYLKEWKNQDKVNTYLIIGLLVLLAAILNFVNLTTARSVRQAKESGVRKTMGASRGNLIKLYYIDTAVVCSIAFVLALGIALLTLPVFGQVIGKTIAPAVLLAPVPLVGLLVVLLLTILLAGSYPALYLSSFSPKEALTRGVLAIRSKGWLRNTLIVAMFMISMVLLSSTFVIWRQTDYLSKMDLGYQPEQLMYVGLSEVLKPKFNSLKEEILKVPGVEAASNVSHLPTSFWHNQTGFDWEGKDPGVDPLVYMFFTDEDMLSTFNGSMAEGVFPARGQNGLLINKTFAKIIGWDSFVGKTFRGGDPIPIAGVVNDFHFNSFNEPTKPLAIIVNYSSNFKYLMIRLKADNLAGTIDQITKVCRSMDAEYPVDYGFMDDKLNDMLKGATDMNKLVGIFSILSMLVLILGLLGMVMFLVEQKTKEIGIRKCHGEDVSSIMLLLVKPFVALGAVATVLATPLAWYAMSRWLQDYAFRIDLNIFIFIGAGLLVTLLAALVVSVQSWRAANANPVDSIKTE